MQDETKLLIQFRDPPPSSRKVKQGHLDEFQFSPFIVINNITVPVKEVRR